MKCTRRSLLHFALGGTCLGVGPMAHAGNQGSGRSYRRAGVAFDTGVALTVAGVSEREAEAALDAGFAEIRRLEAVASLTRPGSTIRQLNATGHLDRPDPALLDMLAVADSVHHASGGAFDVTIQPLWILYDAFAKRGEWPTDQQAAPARALIGQGRITATPERIAFARPGMGITLNSLTHGYAADRVARVLRERGITQAFVDTGEMETLGTSSGGDSWTVAIQNPRHPDEMIGQMPLSGCIATAGDYQYYWSEDYSRHHILDPRTGISPAAFSTVSVMASSAVLADALSTTVSVLGPELSAPLLRHFKAEAYGMTKAGTIWSTPGFPALAKA
jgi:thiamine biosynthesis lipoprotein